MNRPLSFLLLGLCVLSGSAMRAQADTLETPSLTVTTLSDSSTDTDGETSLREAIEYVNSGTAPADPVIDFAPGLNGTIVLGGDELLIDGDVTILGPTGGDSIKVDGDFNSRVFHISSLVSAGIFNLTVTGGFTFSAFNPADSGGGFINEGFLYLRNCVVTHNAAYGGGGVLNLDGFAAIDSCTFSANASSGGGAIATLGGVLIAQNSTFAKNEADNGGALITYSSQTSLTNCTFSANTANYDGGAVNNDDLMIVTNCTFAANTAGWDGDAIYNFGGFDSSETAHLGNNIFSNGAKSENLYSDSGGYPIVSLGHNMNSDNASLDLNDPSDRNNTAAQLGPLQNNGGPTYTYSLPASSPAVNAGDDSLLPNDLFDADGDTDNSEPIPFDQRGSGFPRVQDGNVDIGAYEFLDTPPTSLSAAPATGVSKVGVTRTIAVTYSDADGPTDMTELRLLVNDTPGEANALCAIYDRRLKKIFLLDDDGVTLKGGFAANTANTISNSQGSINCKTVALKTSGNSFTISWNFTPSSTFTGTKNLYGQVTDRVGNTETYKQLGDWTINLNSPPVNGTVSPATSSVTLDKVRSFTSTYTDANGAADISEVRLLVNDTPTTANALCVIYNRATKKVYLLDDDGVTPKGGFLSGSNNVISNSQGSINCSTVGLSAQGNKITLRCNLTPTGSFMGQKNVYLYCLDRDGAFDDFEDLGDLNILPAPASISSTTVSAVEGSAGQS